MNIPTVNRVIYQKYFKLYYPLKSSINRVSTSQKLSSKKRFSIKNKFSFRNEFSHNQAGSVLSEQATTKDLPFEQNGNGSKYDHLYGPDNRYVSADLLSGESLPMQQNLKRPSQVKTRKPSLTYHGEILFGVHPVYLSLLQKKRTFYHLYTRKDIDFSSDNISFKAEIVRLAKSIDVPVSYVDSRGLRILAPGAVHQGVCLDAGFLPLPIWNEDQHLSDVTEKNPLWLVLDEILDPMNVGAIIRSACYFGVQKLFTIRGNSCKLSPTVSKASSGSLEVMNIYQIDSLEHFIRKRKDCGWSIVSTLAYSENKSEFDESTISAAEFCTSKPTILILGNEGRGISEDILKLCDSLISIEPGHILPKGMDSLNVSVAAGVLLYILNSQAKRIMRYLI